MCRHSIDDVETQRRCVLECTREVFNKRLRPDQLDAVMHLLSKKRLLLSWKTGCGKSLVTQVAGVLLGGVSLIVLPLLSLAADQSLKMKGLKTGMGEVKSINLQYFSTVDKRKDLKQYLLLLNEGSNETIFLYICPHQLSEWRTTIKELVKKNVMRQLVIDEYHFVTSHGRTFRSDYKFYYKNAIQFFLKSKTAAITLASATTTAHSLKDISEIFKIPLNPNHYCWHPAEAFLRCEIKVNLFVASQLTEVMKKRFERNFVTEKELRQQFMVFVNSPSESVKYRKKVSEILNQMGVDKHVILLNGNCFPEEKYFAMVSFTAPQSFDEYAGCVFTAGVGSVGIDNPNVNVVIYANIPESIGDFIQGMGRAGRRQGSVMDSNVDVGLDVRGLNFLMDRNHHNIMKLKNMPQRAKQENFDRMTMDLISVVQMFSLRWGCIHARMANHVGNVHMPPINLSSFNCGGKCYMCDGSFDSEFLAVDYAKVQQVFAKFLLSQGSTKIDDLVDSVWADKELLTSLFRKAKSSIRKYHVERFLLQCIGCQILKIPIAIDEFKAVHVTVGYGHDLIPSYLIPYNLFGISVLPHVQNTTAIYETANNVSYSLEGPQKRVRYN